MKNALYAVRFYIIKSLGALSACAVIGLCLILFLGLPLVARLIAGLFSSALVAAVLFIGGGREGFKAFGLIRKNRLGGAGGFAEKIREYAPYKGIFYNAFILLLTIAVMTPAFIYNLAPLRLVGLSYSLPFALIFQGAGVIAAGENVSAAEFIIYAAFALFVCATYAAGYVAGGERGKRQREEIEEELRMFSNVDGR